MKKEDVIACLEQYMDGKDNDIPSRLGGTFIEEAIITFDIRTPKIYFPPKIEGRSAIEKIMFGEFHKSFTNVKSYYLSDDFSDLSTLSIHSQPWLVTMTEVESGFNRVGYGTYDWRFSQSGNSFRVAALHITIIDMISFFNENNWLANFQSALHQYPWTNIEDIARLMSGMSQFSPFFRFLQECRLAQTQHRSAPPTQKLELSC